MIKIWVIETYGALYIITIRLKTIKDFIELPNYKIMESIIIMVNGEKNA